MTESISKILNFLVNVAFMFFGRQIKGSRTAIINTIAIVIAGWTFIAEQAVFPLLCELGQSWNALIFFCSIEQTKFWAVFLAITGALNMILKKLDADDLVGKLPASLRSSEGAALKRQADRYFIGAVIGMIALISLTLFGLISGQFIIVGIIIAFFALYTIIGGIIKVFR